MHLGHVAHVTHSGNGSLGTRDKVPIGTTQRLTRTVPYVVQYIVAIQGRLAFQRKLSPTPDYHHWDALLSTHYKMLIINDITKYFAQQHTPFTVEYAGHIREARKYSVHVRQY